MRAFVLSGGGNRGPLEVGAVQVLLENGIIPEMIVGSSIGAINGLFLAIEPSLQQARHMADLWRASSRRKLLRLSPARSLMQLLRGSDHLTDSRRMAAYLREVLPPQVRCFGDLTLPFYVTIAHLSTFSLYIYGDDPAAPVIDAVINSAAIPGFFEPARVNGEAFYDGGVVSNLPVRVAAARGATEIWAIDLALTNETPNSARGVLPIFGQIISPMLYNSVLVELEAVARMPGVTLHHVPIFDHQRVGLGDFKNMEKMLVAGARVMREYLAHPQPNVVHYPSQSDAEHLPPGPSGSRAFISG
jgi:NTE family protein